MFFVCLIQLASIPGLEDVTVSTPAPAPSGSAASTSAQATAPPPPPSDTPQTAAEVNDTLLILCKSCMFMIDNIVNVNT